MRGNVSGNLGLYKYLWPGSVYERVENKQFPSPGILNVKDGTN